jgi:hypothetical protein
VGDRLKDVNHARRYAVSTLKLSRQIWDAESGLTGGLELVAKGAVIAAFQAAFFALSFACFHQVLEASGTLHRWLTALRAPLVSLHAQLILALPRHWQIRELIFDAFSHFVLFFVRSLQRI